MDEEDEVVQKLKAIHKKEGKELSDEKVYEQAQNLKDLAEFLVKMAIKNAEKKKAKID